MTRAALRAVAPALLLVPLGFPVPALAQEGLGDATIRTQVELLADLGRQSFSASGSSKRRTKRRAFEERLKLDIDGYLIRTGLLRFRMGGDLGLRQHSLDSTEGESSDDRGRLVEHDASFDLFPTSLVALNLFTNRVQDRSTHSLGTDSHTVGDASGAILRLQNRFFPASFSYRRSQITSDAMGLTAEIRREVQRTLLEFTGQHVGELSQLSIRARDEDIRDESFPRLRDLRLQEASGQFRTIWGDYFEHTLRAAMRAGRRTGTGVRDTSSADSSYRWQVTEDLGSELRYQLSRFHGEEGVTTAQTGSFDLSHRLYDSLVTRARISGSRSTQLDGGVRLQRGGDLSLSYTKRFFFASSVRANLNLRRYIEEDQRGFERDPNVPDLDPDLGDHLERQAEVEIQRDQSTGGFPLPVPRGVDQTTIEIEGLWDPNDLKPLAMEDDPYVLENGVVFLIGSDADDFQVLIVTFVYDRPPGSTLEVRELGYALNWDLGWLTLGYQHDQTDEDGLEGEELLSLEASRSDRYSLQLRRDSRSLRSRAALTYTKYRSGTMGRDQWALTETLRWVVTPRVSVRLNLRQTQTEFERTGRINRSLAGSASLSWSTRSGHSVRLFTDVRTLDDSLLDDQLNMTFGARIHFKFGRLEAFPTLNWSLRERGSARAGRLSAVFRLLWTL